MPDGAGPGASSDPGEWAPASSSIEPFGDAALLVSSGSLPGAGSAAWAQAITGALDSARAAAAGIGRAIPAQASVLVPFDPLVIKLADAVGIARRAIAAADAGRETTAATRRSDPDVPAADPIEIRVRYGGIDGPDLDAVAELHGLRPADVAELHASVVYGVLFLGFAPGFGYLGGLPSNLVTPRRTSPRERVPPGSVAIAGDQTAVYPLAMPGGWQLIGRTDVVLFDSDRPEPALLSPGATVRFVPMTDR